MPPFPYTCSSYHTLSSLFLFRHLALRVHPSGAKLVRSHSIGSPSIEVGSSLHLHPINLNCLSSLLSDFRLRKYSFYFILVFAGPTSEASAEDEDDNQSDDSATEVGDFKFINSRAEEALENSKQQLVGVASKLFGRASKVLGKFYFPQTQ